MYVRFQHGHDFPKLGSLLCPGTLERDLDCDCENVYQWMYVTLTRFDATLNISRDHGWSEIPDEVDCQYAVDDSRLLALVHPGPTYATSCGHDRLSEPDLPWRDVAQYIADTVGVSVDLIPGSLNVDAADPEPIETFTPRVPHGG
jgi:hypothetical protein